MSKPNFHRLYVWEWPVRIYHWATAAAMLVLAGSGLIIGAPVALQTTREAYANYWFGTVRYLHFAAAWIFFWMFVLRMYWMVVGNRFSNWRVFFPIGQFGTFFKNLNYSQEETDRAVKYFRTYYRAHGIYENTMYPGMDTLLQKLRAAGCTHAAEPRRHRLQARRHARGPAAAARGLRAGGATIECGERTRHDRSRGAGRGQRQRQRAQSAGHCLPQRATRRLAREPRLRAHRQGPPRGTSPLPAPRRADALRNLDLRPFA